MSALRLSDAAQRLQAARIAPRAERRRFRRLPITLSGRMIGPRGAEIDCRTEDISPGDVRITAAEKINPDERVVIYLDKIGRVSGRVARISGEKEYAIIFDMSAYKREKLADQLTLMIAGAHAEEAGRKIREPKGRAEIEIHVDGGGLIIGEVVDFSLVGMTIRTKQIPPRIGAWVRVSNVDGRVARFTDDGFAIDFESRVR
ncbi:MAG: PilZ domain-containing protein [Hydrogenophilaceae bacterium]|jgi:hypothetical protein|nr:PilZ domain-containing protein [Hydrogenophilaceae bacterium]